MDGRKFPSFHRPPEEREGISEIKNSLGINPFIISMDGERRGNNAEEKKIPKGVFEEKSI